MRTSRTIPLGLVKAPTLLLLILLGCKEQPNTDRAQPQKTSSMEEAIMKGDLSTVKTLQESGYDINKAPSKINPDPNCVMLTPLSLALGFRDREIAEYLLKQHVDVNATNSDGSTALFYAVQKWDSAQDMIKLLLDRGADLNVKTKDGTTPLNDARLAEQPDIVRLLLSRGAQDPFENAVLWVPQAQVDDATGTKSILYGIAHGQTATKPLVIYGRT